MKVSKIILGIVLLASAHMTWAVPIQCDPNATGNLQYPNVACSSTGVLVVGGGTANGSTATGNPTLVSGTDAGGVTRTLRTDSIGELVLGSSGATIGNVFNAPANGAITDCSGTITTGGTAQTAAAVNANRRYLLIQNVSAGNIAINFTSAAQVSGAGGSVLLPANATFLMENGYVATDLISIIGATTAQAYTCKQK